MKNRAKVVKILHICKLKYRIYSIRQKNTSKWVYRDKDILGY